MCAFYATAVSSLPSRVIIILLLYVRLDGKHVVFGQVIDGMDVVDAMERVGSDSGK